MSILYKLERIMEKFGEKGKTLDFMDYITMQCGSLFFREDVKPTGFST